MILEWPVTLQTSVASIKGGLYFQQVFSAAASIQGRPLFEEIWYLFQTKILYFNEGYLFQSRILSYFYQGYSALATVCQPGHAYKW